MMVYFPRSHSGMPPPDFFKPGLKSLDLNLKTKICTHLELKDLLHLRVVCKWDFSAYILDIIAKEFGADRENLSEREAVEYIGDQIVGIRCLPEHFIETKEEVPDYIATLYKLKKLAKEDFISIYQDSKFTHSLREARFLMQFDGYPNWISKNRSFPSPLFSSVESGDSEAVDYILSNLRDTPYTSYFYKTPTKKRRCLTEVAPLEKAARRGDVKIIESLIASFGKAIASISNSRKKTPLFYAVKSNNPQAVRILLAAGACILSMDGKGDTPLHYAARIGHTIAMYVLIEQGKILFSPPYYHIFISALNSNLDTPLKLAIKNKQLDANKMLLENGALERDEAWIIKSKNGNTLLHYAAGADAIEIIDILIEKAKQEPECFGTGIALDSFISAQNDALETPLHAASFSKSTKALEKLLQNGASVSAINNKGETPLHYAAQTGALDILCILLEHARQLYWDFEEEFDDYLSTQDDSGKTALHYALEFCVNHTHALAVEMLLKYGAKPNLDDYEKTTPLHIAAKGLKFNTSILLPDPEISRNSLSEKAAAALTSQAVDLLLEYGASPNLANAEGETPLHCAAQAYNDKAISALLEIGAQPNSTDRWGNTPLHLAAQVVSAEKNAYLTTFELLLKHHAHVNAINSSKETPLHLLAKYFLGKSHSLKRASKREAIRMLLEKGADLNLTDFIGKTSIDYARQVMTKEEVDALFFENAKKPFSSDGGD